MASTSPSAAPAERLLQYQNIVAVTSDIDLSLLQPAMADRSPMPLVNIIGWGKDRLQKLSRWRSSEDPAREIVRTYAKVLIALEELESAASRLPLQPSVLTGPVVNTTKVSFSEPKFASATPAGDLTLHPPPVAGGLVLKSSLRRKPAAAASAAAPASRYIQWSVPAGLPVALPLHLLQVFQTWSAAFRVAGHMMLWVLNWLPLFFFVAAAVLVIGHPTLALRLFWKALGVLPTAFGSYVDYLLSSPPVPPTPVPMGHMLMELPSFDPTLHGSVAAPPALTGHCSPEPESLWKTTVMLLIAGEGGAAVGFMAAMRGLFAGQAA